jgi:hypothetical protein
MTSRISDIARYTSVLLSDLNCDSDGKKVKEVNKNLETSIQILKGLKWDDLCAIKDDKRHELTMRQQNVIECYANLKRVLLETYRDIFQQLKEM